MKEPRIIMLVIAASIRHSGGMTFAYNADLYYNIYFPDVDLGWWLFGVTIGIGSVSYNQSPFFLNCIFNFIFIYRLVSLLVESFLIKLLQKWEFDQE